MGDVEVHQDSPTRELKEAEMRPIREGSVPSTPPERGPGDVIGRYTLLARLGMGGMGVVFAAHDARLDREVALKLLRPSLGRRHEAWTEGRDRLRREAQAMAQLSHPNVVEIFDVGTDGDDLYIAMARIRGRSLRAWLAEVERPWQEIVGVFVQAGRGLAAAHAAELVHRDFKPSNVLVDREGRVRVLDFGLALPTMARRRQSGVHPSAASSSGLYVERPNLDSTATDRLTAPLTEAGLVMGTPAYMAPEQHIGSEVGPAGDQYSFCAALYEGLYGARPFRGKDITTLLRAKVEGHVAEVKREGKIPRTLHGLLARGLAPVPKDRWPSMQALLAKLEAVVRPRRRWPWIAGLVAAALGWTLIYGTEEGDSEVDPVCAETNAQRTRAWGPSSRLAVRAALVEGAASYAVDTAARVERKLDDYVARWDALHESVCEALPEQTAAGSLPDRQLGCLKRRLRRVQTLVEVLAKPQLGLLSRSVSLVEGLPALDRCGEASPEDEDLMVPDDPELAARVQELHTRLEAAKTWVDAGLYDEAHELIIGVYEDAQTAGYAPMVDLAGAWLGTTLLHRGEFEAAEAQLVETLHRAEAAGRDRLVVTITTRLVSLVGNRLGRPEEGLRWARHGEAAVARLEGDRVPEAELRTSVGAVLADAGKAEEGAVQLRKAVVLWTALAGIDSLDVAAARNNLGIALYNLGRYEDSIAEYEEVLRIREQTLGPEHPDIGVVLNNLGNARAVLGEHEEAATLRRRVLAIWSESLGEDHPYVAAALNNLGGSASVLGNYEEAIELFERANAIRERTLGSEHPELGTSLLNLGISLGDVGRYEEGLEHLRRARTILERSMGEHPWTAACIAVTGQLLLDQGRPEAALVELEAGLAMQLRLHGPDHPEIAVSHALLGRTLASLGQLDDARTQLERALAMFETGSGLLNEFAHARFALARVLGRQGKAPERARRLAEQAREYWESQPKLRGGTLPTILAWLADAP